MWLKLEVAKCKGCLHSISFVIELKYPNVKSERQRARYAELFGMGWAGGKCPDCVAGKSPAPMDSTPDWLQRLGDISGTKNG